MHQTYGMSRENLNEKFGFHHPGKIKRAIENQNKTEYQRYVSTISEMKGVMKEEWLRFESPNDIELNRSYKYF